MVSGGGGGKAVSMRMNSSRTSSGRASNTREKEGERVDDVCERTVLPSGVTGGAAAAAASEHQVEMAAAKEGGVLVVQ